MALVMHIYVINIISIYICILTTQIRAGSVGRRMLLKDLFGKSVHGTSYMYTIYMYINHSIYHIANKSIHIGSG